jgi:hypothetical protein
MLETTKTKLRNHKAGIEKVDTKVRWWGDVRMWMKPPSFLRRKTLNFLKNYVQEYQALERRVEVLEKKLVQMDNVDERVSFPHKLCCYVHNANRSLA